MYFPGLKIDLGKIFHNAKLINDRCAGSGISVIGITRSLSENWAQACSLLFLNRSRLKEEAICSIGDDEKRRDV